MCQALHWLLWFSVIGDGHNQGVGAKCIQLSGMERLHCGNEHRPPPPPNESRPAGATDSELAVARESALVTCTGRDSKADREQESFLVKKGKERSERH